MLSTHPWVLGQHRKQLVGGACFWIDNGLSPQCHRLSSRASSSPTPVKTEARSPSINGDFSINDHCYESVYSAVLKLHHLTPFSCQLSPSARLLGILLDGLKLPPVHRERQRPESIFARVTDGQRLSVHINCIAAHHLLRD
jgi:hypothetical protein